MGWGHVDFVDGFVWSVQMTGLFGPSLKTDRSGRGVGTCGYCGRFCMECIDDWSVWSQFEDRLEWSGVGACILGLLLAEKCY